MPSAWKPVKKSPVHSQLARDGATMAEVSGWVIAEHFGNPHEEARTVRTGVGLSDLSSVEKWEIKGSGSPQFLSAVFGIDTPEPGHVARASSGILCRVSRHHALFVQGQAEPLAPGRLFDNDAMIGCVHVTDRSNGLANFLLCGPRARDVLGKLTSLDLRESRFPDLTCACGPIAAIGALVVRRDRGELSAYEILFTREYGEYLWEVVKEAGREYQLRPFGMAATRFLEP